MSVQSRLTEPVRPRGLLPLIIVLIETTVEVVGLVLWLGLQRGDIPALLDGVVYGRGILSAAVISAAVILFVLLLSEHLISQVQHTDKRISAPELRGIIAFTFLEVVVWVVWLLLIPINPLLAFGFFFVSLYVEHQITYNVKLSRKGVKLSNFLNRHLATPRNRRLVFVGLVVFTISEVVGASIWVALVDGGLQTAGLVALVVGSLIEHYIAGRVANIKINGGD